MHVVGANGDLPDATAERESDLVVASVVDAAVQPRDGGFFGHRGECLSFRGEKAASTVDAAPEVVKWPETYEGNGGS
jgi:hypothetical protein